VPSPYELVFVALMAASCNLNHNQQIARCNSSCGAAGGAKSRDFCSCCQATRRGRRIVRINNAGKSSARPIATR